MTPTIVEVANGTVDSVQLVEELSVVAIPFAGGVDDGTTDVVSVQVDVIVRLDR
jgi:hypothetical protein